MLEDDACTVPYRRPSTWPFAPNHAGKKAVMLFKPQALQYKEWGMKKNQEEDCL